MYLSVHSNTVYYSQAMEVCPSTEDWINKMWYIYTMEYYSVIKRMKIAATWMNLEMIVLRQRKENTIGYPLYVESKIQIQVPES